MEKSKLAPTFWGRVDPLVWDWWLLFKVGRMYGYGVCGISGINMLCVY